MYISVMYLVLDSFHLFACFHISSSSSVDQNQYFNIFFVTLHMKEK
jgi:hypothetical protein